MAVAAEDIGGRSTLGPHRGGPRAPDAGWGASPLTRTARIVPTLATFAVDSGFTYRVPDTLGRVEVGSLVRVPLGGRRTRGFVTEISDGGDGEGLRDVLGVVGDLPVFTPRLLSTLRWAAVHYVAPLSVMLATATPPNAPRRRGDLAEPGTLLALESPLPGVTAAAVAGHHTRSTYAVGGGPWADWLGGLASDVLDAGRNVAVVVPTVHEAVELVDRLEDVLGRAPMLATSSAPAADVTRTWSRLQRGDGSLVVGTREIASWSLGRLGVVAIVEEGRPAMKAPQTPTVGVRDLVRRRSASERFPLVFAGPVPTVETLATGVDIQEPERRVWPLVEIVDRSTEPPGPGVVMDATSRAIQGVLRGGGEVFVFVTRRGDAAAFRCVGCGAIRRCGVCGSGASRGDVCARCDTALGRCPGCGGGRFQALGAGIGRVVGELRRSIGAAVTPVDGDGAVRVGTERDLPEVRSRSGGGVALSVVIDADSLLLAPHYRAEEDALRTMARVALTVPQGRGRRCLIQTGQPGHRVLEALRVGHPTGLLRRLLDERGDSGFPPRTELMAIEVTGGEGVDRDIRDAGPGVSILGPASSGDAARWLVSASDLRGFKLSLREMVQRWRDGGARVRVEVDPVRL